MDTEFFVTEDGSHTLFVPEIDECYHSSHGAVQESMHIFIKTGLKQCAKQEINILEIGFGTGLNAFLTMLEAEKTQKMIHYTTLELFPVETEKACRLNYPELVSPENKSAFEQLHTSSWNERIQITQHFELLKIETDFTSYNFQDTFDVIFFDAFSPEKQPEMWTEKQFIKLYQSSNNDAVLTTYCAKGAVRRAMQQAGFRVERLPGPPGKREMLRASKTFENELTPLA